MSLISFDISKVTGYSLAAIAIFILGYVIIAMLRKINLTNSSNRNTNGYATKEGLTNHHEYTKDKLNNILNRLEILESEVYDLHDKEINQSEQIVKEIMELTGLIKELLIYFKNIYHQK